MKKCTKCEEIKPLDKFHSKRSQCKACRKTYMEQYRRNNKEKILSKKKEWYQNLDQAERWERNKKCIESTPVRFLADQMYHIKSRSERPDHPRNASCPAKRQFDLDRDYLRKMWESQDGRCAITNVPMVHKFGRLNSVSIDRIDSSLGHVKSNIQLVCLGINRLKHEHSNEEVCQFLERINDTI